jgi:hypothetical protein
MLIFASPLSPAMGKVSYRNLFPEKNPFMEKLKTGKFMAFNMQPIRNWRQKGGKSIGKSMHVGIAASFRIFLERPSRKL